MFRSFSSCCSVYLFISPPDKPVIVHRSSSWVVKEFEVLCLCAVDSNPRPAVTWTVNGSLPSSSYNTSVISYNKTLVAVMRGPMVTPLRVVCVTTNSLGNDSHTLLEGGEGKQQRPFLQTTVRCYVSRDQIVVMYALY